MKTVNEMELEISKEQVEQMKQRLTKAREDNIGDTDADFSDTLYENLTIDELASEYGTLIDYGFPRKLDFRNYYPIGIKRSEPLGDDTRGPNDPFETNSFYVNLETKKLLVITFTAKLKSNKQTHVILDY